MIKLLKAHPFFSDKQIDSCTLLATQGFCNENYILMADDKKYIARKLVITDIDRDLEYQIQQLAFKEGITAEPLVFDKKNGFMIFEFLEGVHKSQLNQDDLKCLAETLNKLHSIEINSKPIDIVIEHKTVEVLSAFETIGNYLKENVLCHNDLNPQNIFFTDKVKFIDWEYAGVNDRYFDLASICVEFSLDEQDKSILLKSYFNDEIIESKKLEAYKTIYIALCKQWFEESEATQLSQI